MGWGDQVAATGLTGITTTPKVFDFAGSEIVTLNPGEVCDGQVKMDNGVGTTDGAIVKIYKSTVAAPGTRPTTDPNVADDWALYRSFSIAKEDVDEWKPFSVSAVASFCVVLWRDAGTTDTISGECQFRKDGVSV